MFTVIGIMFVGIGLGYLLRRQSLPWINKAITALIWLLLFLLGIEVGHNEQIIRSLPTLGVEAFAIALVCVLGSCLAAWGWCSKNCHIARSNILCCVTIHNTHHTLVF